MKIIDVLPTITKESGTFAKIVTIHEKTHAQKFIIYPKANARVGTIAFRMILNVPSTIIRVAGTIAGIVHIAVRSWT